MHSKWVALLVLASGCSGADQYKPMDGDIVFHVSRSDQSTAIQLATGSPYSHMGIVYLNDGSPFVFEAIQPVTLTPLDEWTARGERGHFVAKRLRDVKSLLTKEALRGMRAVGEGFSGKDYDLYFEWSDERFYCSELVWKIFKRGAGVEIGRLAHMSDFDLSHPAVRAKLEERFGQNVPLQETVISPADIFNAPELWTVYEN